MSDGFSPDFVGDSMTEILRVPIPPLAAAVGPVALPDPIILRSPPSLKLEMADGWRTSVVERSLLVGRSLLQVVSTSADDWLSKRNFFCEDGNPALVVSNFDSVFAETA